MTQNQLTEIGFVVNQEDQGRQQIKTIKENLSEAKKVLEDCHLKQEKFCTAFHNLKERKKTLNSMKKQIGNDHSEVKRLEKLFSSKNSLVTADYKNLTTKRDQLIDEYKKMCETYKKILEEFLNQIVQWKREQQLAGNGHNLNKDQLPILQEICNSLSETIWPMRQQIKQVLGLKEKVPDSPVTLNDQDLLNNVHELLGLLLKETLIVEKQPPQVLKKNEKFESKIRLMAGSVLSNSASPKVMVTIISEEQASQLKYEKRDQLKSGSILNGTGRNMEHQIATKELSVTFPNLQLTSIERPENTVKETKKPVLDQKFALVFWTEFVIGEGELTFQIWTLSTPVVLISHDIQKPHALATVTWDNAFAKPIRRPFYVEDNVTWGQVSEALNMKWISACGGPLTKENLHYLACKAFRNNSLSQNMEEVNKLMISWSLFCKENLPNQSFTFWDWFLKSLVLTHGHMADLWKAGHIEGFISKEKAEAMLQDKLLGTFLLRFSDSVLGGITIAYARRHGFSVGMVAPFTTNNLKQRRMANIICDLPELTMRYPCVSKEELKEFATPTTPQPPGGYIPHVSVWRLNPQDKETDCFFSGEFDFQYNDDPVFFQDVEMDETSNMEMDEISNLDISTLLQMLPSTNL